MTEPHHMLANIDGLDAKFPRNAQGIAGQFVKRLAIDRTEKLTADVVLITATRRLKERSVAESVDLWKFENEYALQLIAFVGEEAIKRFGGGWRMVLGYDGKTLEPWVVAKSGDVRAPFDILDEFEQDPDDFDLKARFSAIMGVPRNRWAIGFDSPNG